MPCLDSCHKAAPTTARSRSDRATLQSSSRVPIPKSNEDLLQPNLRWTNACLNLILFRCVEWRMVGLALLFVRFQESARSAGMPSFNFIRIPMISPLSGA